MRQSNRRNKKATRSASRKMQVNMRTRDVIAKGPNGSYIIPQGWQYGDISSNLSVTTTPTSSSILGAIGSVLALAPQCTRPVYQNGGLVWRASVKVHAISMILKAVGSQATALIPADLYNFVRVVIGKNSFGSNTTPSNLLVAIDSNLNLLDWDTILYDKRKQLLSQAFDVGDYNVPGAWIDDITIPVNRIVDFETSVAAGTSGWGTNNESIWYFAVTDSSVSPSPTVVANFRVWFSIL